MRHLILTAALLAGLAAPVSAGDHRQDDPFLTPESAVPDWEAPRMPAPDLALAFLVATEITSGGTAMAYELCKRSGPPCATAYQILHYPDGSTEIVTLKTFDELEQFVTKWQRLKDEYKEAIVQRGFKRLAPSYDVTVSRSCSDKWLGSGRVAVQQVEFMFGLQQAGKEFWGAVVEDSVTVIFPGGFEPPLVAKFGEIIELQDTESKCSITLRAN